MFGSLRCIKRIYSKLSPHTFSLHVKNLEKVHFGEEIVIEDSEVVKRIKNILRLNEKDHIQFFDGKFKCMTSIIMDNNSKNLLRFKLRSNFENVVSIGPQIDLFIGLLKKEGMEEVARTCGFLGISSLRPILTQKVQREWNVKEMDRLNKIVVAGCEQSKNCVITKIHDIISFQDFISQTKTVPFGIHFDHHGTIPLLQMMNRIEKEQPKEISIFIGPEGDVTEQESNLLPWNKVLLTKSTLTSVDSTMIALGSLKSIF